MQLCGDYKVTANKAIMTEHYTTLKIEEIFSRLAGAKYFVKLDMSEAYPQLSLDVESQEMMTVNTTQGLFAVKHLLYGVSSAPMIFQRTMDSTFEDLDGTSTYIDDFQETGRTEAELCKCCAWYLNICQQQVYAAGKKNASSTQNQSHI